MARIKARWEFRFVKPVFAEGSKIVIMGRLAHDPGRILEGHLPRSSAEALIKQIAKAADMTVTIGEAEEVNGKHHLEDEF